MHKYISNMHNLSRRVYNISGCNNFSYTRAQNKKCLVKTRDNISYSFFHDLIKSIGKRCSDKCGMRPLLKYWLSFLCYVSISSCIICSKSTNRSRPTAKVLTFSHVSFKTTELLQHVKTSLVTLPPMSLNTCPELLTLRKTSTDIYTINLNGKSLMKTFTLPYGNAHNELKCLR